MSATNSTKRSAGPSLDLSDAQTIDAHAIDALYGLEPVFEPGAASDEPTQVVSVQCPYCGESIDTVIDLSAGSFRYIEDCQVCCAPIDLAGEVDDEGALVGVTAERA
jgi:hypothetical protein